jgi:hypothetical protein
MRVSVGVAVIVVIGAMPAAATTKSVPPGKYVTRVCEALSVFSDSTSVSVISAGQKYKDAPSQDTAIGFRQALLDEFNGFDGAADYLTRTTLAAGIPDIRHGKQFAAALVDHEKQLKELVLPLRPQAEAIDVSSSTGFITTLQAVSKNLNAAAEASKTQARKAAAVKGAPEAMRRLVTYLTTTASKCASK